MFISMSDVRQRLFIEYTVVSKTFQVGSNYYHDKVEIKIQEVKKSFVKSIVNFVDFTMGDIVSTCLKFDKW